MSRKGLTCIQTGVLLLGIPITVSGSILTDVHGNLAIGLPLLILGCVMLVASFISIIFEEQNE